MKYRNFLLICICSFLTIAFMACDKTDNNNISGSISNLPVTVRGDCQDCPEIDECCCYVALDPNDNNNSASIELCGIVGGSSTCSSFSGTCFSTNINNGSHATVLTSPSNIIYNFCMEHNSLFYIRNTHGTDPASVKISCQRGQTSPQVISVNETLPLFCF